MSISEKNKITNNKITQNKAQCDFDRETAVNCKCKYEFLTDKDVLPEKILARKSWSEVIYNTEILKSNLCDYNNACILVRGNVTIIGHHETQIAFKIVLHLLNVSKKLM